MRVEYSNTVKNKSGCYIIRSVHSFDLTYLHYIVACFLIAYIYLVMVELKGAGKKISHLVHLSGHFIHLVIYSYSGPGGIVAITPCVCEFFKILR